MAELDAGELLAWLVAVLVLVVVPLVAVHPEGARRALGPQVERWLAQLAPEEPADPLADALRAQIRRESVIVHVQRLRRVLATDENESAVRQIGHRMAYASLLLELEALQDAPPAYAFAALGSPSPVPETDRRWRDDLALPVVTTRGWSPAGGQRAPAVEVLELGPRRRAAH